MDNQSEFVVRDWSSLPSDILSEFLHCLNDTETDRCRLRGVCTTWRSSISPPPPPSPLKYPVKIMFPFPALFSLFSAKKENEIGMLRQSMFYLISSPDGSSSPSVWLTRVEEKPDLHNTYQLQNPITPIDEFAYPSPELKVKINFLDHKIYEVARSYCLHGCINQLLTKKTVMVMLPKSGATPDHFCLLALWNDKKLGLFKSETEKWVNLPIEYRL